jgi:hypothetical protein
MAEEEENEFIKKWVNKNNKVSWFYVKLSLMGRGLGRRFINTFGGLVSSMAEVLAEESLGPLKRLGFPDLYGTVGTHAQILDKHNVGIADIVKAAKDLCGRKTK